MRVGIVSLVLLALWSAPAWAQDLVGRYSVSGRNADGSAYKGQAEIVGTSTDTCRISWQVGTSSSGFCMRNGDALAAAYKLGDSVGLIIYRIKSDGSLVGRWTIADLPGAGSETLVPLR